MVRRNDIWTRTLRIIIPGGITVVIFFLNGCGVPQPGVRLGSYATATLGTNFLDLNSMGKHSFGSAWFEKNGIVYTCRGGHIDIAHARIAADNVRYLQDKARRTISGRKHDFSFKLKVEPSTYYVRIEYPQKWKKLSAKERRRITDEVSLEMGEYLTYTMTTWHEVLTWFGFKTMGFIPEQPSAFSWEDIYSNVFGIRIGSQAIRDKSHGYDQAVTIAMRKDLEDLGVQSAKTARKASDKMRGTWYMGLLIAEMKVRNTDVGIEDGYVTPMLVPGVCEGAEPKSYPVPTLEKSQKYGFEMDLRVEPKEFERGKILDVIYPDRAAPEKIQPDKHLLEIMDYINKSIEKKAKSKAAGT